MTAAGVHPAPWPADPTRLDAEDPGRSRSRLPAALWAFPGAMLFRLSPKPLYKARVRLLNLFGARLHPTARVRPDVSIDRPWNLSMGRKSSLGDGVVVWAHAPVTIGARCTISQYCRLAAFREPVGDPGAATSPAPLTIGDDVWIAAESYVAGGQTIPDGVLAGARSVIDGPLEPWTICAGEPAASRRPRPFKGRKP